MTGVIFTFSIAEILIAIFHINGRREEIRTLGRVLAATCLANKPNRPLWHPSIIHLKPSNSSSKKLVGRVGIEPTKGNFLTYS